MGLLLFIAVLPMSQSVWEFIHGFAGVDKPDLVTFYDHYDEVLYRDVHLKVIGQHGWQLVSVFRSEQPGKESRYEYFFQRNRNEGFSEGLGRNRGE